MCAFLALADACGPRACLGGPRVSPSRPRVLCSPPARLAPCKLAQQQRQRSLVPKAAATAATAAAATAAAAGLLPEAAAAAGGGAMAAVALQRLLQVVDVHVLGATTGAAAKLAMVCVLVGWLIKTEQLPSNTATVMSRVSFTLLIPAMLFTKVATTLAAQPAPSVLATISVATLLQVAVGALLAKAVAPIVDCMLPQAQQSFDLDGSEGSSSSSSSSRPVSGGRGSASELAATSQAASGAGQAGLRSLVTLACAFGSSFTLPVVFFTQMLPAASAEAALGYTALILLSWSPCLWGWGLHVASHSGSSEAELVQQAQQAKAGGPEAAGTAAAAASSSADSSPLAAAWQEVVAFCRHVVTPPFLAILAGMLAGLTPAGRALVGLGGSAAATAGAPAGAVACASSALLRSCMDVVKMLAGGTLAAQTVVLAASLLQQPGGAGTSSGTAGAASAPAGQHLSRRPQPSVLSAARRLLLPESCDEARALATVAITRFLLLPSLTLAAVWGLGRAGLLPAAVAADPVLLLVLLVQAVMPSAQNLIVLCTLSPNTAHLAPMLASMLLKLYALSVAPVSLWVSAWATWLHVAVA